MTEGSVDDWSIINEAAKRYDAGLEERVLAHFQLLKGEYGGFAIDRNAHLLQSSTLMQRTVVNDENEVCSL